MQTPTLSGRRTRRATILLTLAAALAWGACVPATDEAPATAEPVAAAAEVEAALGAFVDAWAAEDAEAVIGTFTADAVAFDPVPPFKFAGTEGIRAWVSGAFEQLDGISIPLSEVEVDTEGRVAWSTARYTFQAESPEGPVSDEGYVSMVWVLQDDGAYRATLFHASNVEEEPAGEG